MKQIILFLFLITVFYSCKEKYTPKPRGFFRIDFPEKKYHKISDEFPYSFDVADYSEITPDKYNPDQPYWINIDVPANRAEIHISYYSLEETGNSGKKHLAELMEETRRLAYKHSIKADAIEEQIFLNPKAKVYGTIYRINGNAASPMQFFLTDSTDNFLRGAFYIRETPDIDSLQPVIDFFEPDIIHIIETTTWN
ncbi:gliding motility lipoprotein GldD [Draconibacterium sp.]|nr:gliding motility lipoprotein GldD [Draconibacterium sp.]